jgi:hypothetical protein
MVSVVAGFSRARRRYLQGWQGYLGFCQTPTVLDRFNKWIRRRIRSAACKQWRSGKTRYARLRQLGLSHDLAARTAVHQWEPWRLSRTQALSYAMPHLLRRLGTSSFALHPRRLTLPNRRVRTRTHGGVTGKASDRLPMSIPWPALETRASNNCREASFWKRELLDRTPSMSALAIMRQQSRSAAQLKDVRPSRC